MKVENNSAKPVDPPVESVTLTLTPDEAVALTAALGKIPTAGSRAKSVVSLADMYFELSRKGWSAFTGFSSHPDSKVARQGYFDVVERIRNGT